MVTGNEVAGFSITDNFNEGILLNGGGNISIHDNTIVSVDAPGLPDAGTTSREGIRLLNMTGTSTIMNNIITSPGRDGIKLSAPRYFEWVMV
jgi:hypothetical protein